jgi:ketosteroid isomerase-like protein
VLAAFNALLEGIRHADVNAVASAYWNSPQLILFNYNGSVTRGWETMRANRASSYPNIRDVKLDVRDLHVTMLGREGALVTCLWTQSQTENGRPDTVSGRMTLVFKRIGNTWKAVHLHTSPDSQNSSHPAPSEHTTQPNPSQ